MMDNEAPGIEPETESAGIGDILAGNQSAPAPQVEQPKAEEAPAPEAAAPEVKPETKPEAEQPFWYRKRLKEIEQRAKAAEQRAQQLEAAQGRGQPEPQQFNSIQEYVEHTRMQDKLERSEDRFIDKHGEQEFQALFDWLETRHDIQAVAVGERHPWAYAYEQYKVAKIRDEIGDDPSGWTARKEKEIEERLLAKLSEQGFQSPGQAMTTAAPRIPAPASGQRSAAPRNSAGQFAGPTPLGDIIGKR